MLTSDSLCHAHMIGLLQPWVEEFQDDVFDAPLPVGGCIDAPETIAAGSAYSYRLTETIDIGFVSSVCREGGA